MRVVGLISGGKDSIWNLHYCRQFGHEVTCLANLAPPPGVSELDSYMYQTVGSDVIDSIAAALELPLVRRIIAGKPESTSSQAYSPQENDEVEDLTLLLRDVLQAHPDVQAVSCGAILSNYQRLRVESVCGRLGLKVLAFMWMQEQPLLLRQMVDSQVDARIVKVASMGLDARHVGESILNPSFSSYLFGLGRKWGVHVCGEGGEYETTVVDAPMYRKAVNIIASEKATHPDGENDDVVFLRVTDAAAEAKAAGSREPPFAELEAYSSLRYYQETFPQLEPGAAGRASEPGRPEPAGDADSCSAAAAAGGSTRGPRQPALRWTGHALASSSLDVAAFGLPAGGAATEQCEALLGAVCSWLAGVHQLSLRDAVFVELQVRDLGRFEEINGVYGRHFAVEPPPRVCIQTELPESVHLRMRLLLRDPSHTPGAACESEGQLVRSLRVQSISTWAMACIGPYSQALRLGALLLSAGVIGLVPHTMALPSAAQAKAAVAACRAASDDDPGAAPPDSDLDEIPPWRAELWMLMRSLGNVLRELDSGFAEVCLAHVYTSGECDAGEVCRHVLGYMQREDANVAPIVVYNSVSRLPKDGHVEVNVVCAKGDLAPPSSSVSSCQLGLAPDSGRVTVTSRRLPGAFMSVTEFEADGDLDWSGLPGDAAAGVIEHCVAAAWQSLEAQAGCQPASSSLQVHFGAHSPHDVVEAAVNAAVDRIGAASEWAISYMPVVSLGSGRHVRLVLLAACSDDQ